MLEILAPWFLAGGLKHVEFVAELRKRGFTSPEGIFEHHLEQLAENHPPLANSDNGRWCITLAGLDIINWPQRPARASEQAPPAEEAKSVRFIQLADGQGNLLDAFPVRADQAEILNKAATIESLSVMEFITSNIVPLALRISQGFEPLTLILNAVDYARLEQAVELQAKLSPKVSLTGFAVEALLRQSNRVLDYASPDSGLEMEVTGAIALLKLFSEKIAETAEQNELPVDGVFAAGTVHIAHCMAERLHQAAHLMFDYSFGKKRELPGAPA